MISEEWVLTAAHCVDGEATEVVGVIMINCIKHSIFTVVYIYIYQSHYHHDHLQVRVLLGAHNIRIGSETGRTERTTMMFFTHPE